MNNKNFDFSLFYKTRFASINALPANDVYDIFISAYNDSERVKEVFAKMTASKKHWLVLPQYAYSQSELPSMASLSEELYLFDSTLSEGQIIRDYINRSGIDFTNLGKICIDITGFIRPHLVFLIRLLSQYDIKVDFIYTDPISYVKKEATDFSYEYTEVRQINGCQGVHNPDTHNDWLVIGAGYDNNRITDIAKDKANTKKVQLFGFPSLQPDMYQENILKAYTAEEATSNGRESFIDPDSTIFAPANDPFVTANVLKEFIQRENRKSPISNLYLSPLSTKVQTLGIALYYTTNCVNLNASIVFPMCDKYSRETTEGISRIWKFTVDFSALK